jgi:acyl-CoA dehydrogenase
MGVEQDAMTVQPDPEHGVAAPRFARTLFEPEHEIFRDAVRRFLEAEVVPHYADWEEAGVTPRSIWLRAGEQGLLGTSIAEAYGGAEAGFLYDAVVIEELGRLGLAAPAWDLHSYIVAPFLTKFGTDDQKARYLPGMAAGSIITSIGMTEPDTGSDLQGIRTAAVRDGDDYVVNGAKTFITNGIIGDLILLVVKTDPSLGARGVSLLLVDADAPGYVKSRNLKKIGNKAQDTAVLYFEDVRVPAANRLGEENDGWRLLMSGLVQERLIVAVRAMAICEAALETTVGYTKDRKAFGKRIIDFQNSRFKLADAATQVQVGRVFVDRCIAEHAAGWLDSATAAMAKLWTTELQDRVLDDCLQLHGGMGYMWESWIARAWADARVHRIYAGTNEIMREIIGRAL